MGALHRLHQSSLHYDNRYPTSADAFDAPQGNPTTNLFPLLPLGPGALPFYRTGWLDCFFISLFLLSYLMETGAKNTRPQALPRAKESVMIPTLLMNITRTRKQQQQQHKVNICLLWLWVFLIPASLFLFFSFILFVIAAWRTVEEMGKGIQRRTERKKGENARWHRQGRCTRDVYVATTSS
jgi:hypothetical protein